MSIKNTKFARYAESAKSTTIRIREDTKKKLEELDFVRKHTFDEILEELIKHYEGKK